MRKPLAMLIALALLGYALTSDRFEPDHPARRQPPNVEAIAAFSDLRQKHLTAAGEVGAWLTFAEALEGNGRTADAAEALREALVKNPNSPDLWIGLGNALILHAEGQPTPAALMAYQRGEALGDRRPELHNFRALACRSGGC